jgi:hypothetical protein
MIMTDDMRPSVEKAVHEVEEMEESLRDVAYTLTRMKEKDIKNVIIYLPVKSKRKLKALTYGLLLAHKFKATMYLYFDPEVQEKEPNFMSSVPDRIKRLCDSLDVSLNSSSMRANDLEKLEFEDMVVVMPDDVKVDTISLPRPILLV